MISLSTCLSMLQELVEVAEQCNGVWRGLFVIVGHAGKQACIHIGRIKGRKSWEPSDDQMPWAANASMGTRPSFIFIPSGQKQQEFP